MFTFVCVCSQVYSLVLSYMAAPLPPAEEETASTHDPRDQGSSSQMMMHEMLREEQVLTLASSLRGCTHNSHEASTVVFNIKRIIGIEDNISKLRDMYVKTEAMQQQGGSNVQAVASKKK